MQTAETFRPEPLSATNARLVRALHDLLDQIDSLDDYTLTRDIEPYKAEACWDEALRYARRALAQAAQAAQ